MDLKKISCRVSQLSGLHLPLCLNDYPLGCKYCSLNHNDRLIVELQDGVLQFATGFKHVSMNLLGCLGSLYG